MSEDMFDFLRKRYSLAESGVLSGSVDAHSHILFGVDDGSRSSESSLEMLSYEESLGVADVWCTPHIMEDVPNTTEALQKRFEELKALYKGPIRLHLAAEYMMDNLFQERFSGRDLLYHGPGCVLVETSVNTPPINLGDILFSLTSAGITPLLAHPERYRYLEKDDYISLHREGVLFQMNVSSLTEYYGKNAAEKAEWLLEKRFYYTVGSDCHRAGGIREQYTHKNITGDTIRRLGELLETQPEKSLQDF